MSASITDADRKAHSRRVAAQRRDANERKQRLLVEYRAG
jgi:hypothetical protein